MPSTHFARHWFLPLFFGILTSANRLYSRLMRQMWQQGLFLLNATLTAVNTQSRTLAASFCQENNAIPRWRKNAWPSSSPYKLSKSIFSADILLSRRITVHLPGYTDPRITPLVSPVGVWLYNHTHLTSYTALEQLTQMLMPSPVSCLDRNDLRLVAGEGKGSVRSHQMLPELFTSL